jgi:glycosyltransferase involved in cell wall biosynthesis
MKRICFILPWFIKDAVGGAELVAYYTAKELLSRGWEVHYICEARSVQEYDQHEGMTIHRIPNRRQYLQGLNYWALKKKMHEIKANFWYCRSSKIYPVTVEKIARQSGGKTIWGLGNDGQADNRIYGSTNLKRRLKKQFIHRITCRGIPRIPIVLAQNRYQGNSLKRVYGVDAHILYNGHPIPKCNQLYAQDRQNLVLWVGHLRPGKRPDLFVSLAESGESNSIQYKMIASGNEPGLSRFVEENAGRLPQFEFLGERTVDEVNQILLRACALVTTSESEGFPNTHIQAWMRGVPVVSTGIDPDDLIKERGLGIVVSNADGLHDAVHKLMSDDQYWNEMSRRCRAFSESNFDIRRIVDKLIDILNEV